MNRNFVRLSLVLALLLSLVSLSGAAQSTLQFVPGTMTTVYGTGTAGAGTNQESAARGVAVDAAGNLFIADTGNNRVLKITAAGVASTYAGKSPGGFGGDGGLATAALLHGPEDIALDAAGNLYIADSTNNRIRMVTPAGIISTVVGSSLTAGYGGDGAAATSALLNTPWGVAFDPAGNMYIADSLNNCIRVVNPSTQVINSFAGVCTTGTSTFGGDGASALAAHLKGVRGVATDAAGNVYIADSGNFRIRVVTSGIINTILGTGGSTFNGDGLAGTATTISQPSGVVVDAAGAVYAGDVGNLRIRRLLGGIVSTVAGTGTSGYNGDSIPATTAQIGIPVKVTVDAAGNLYIGDSLNRIRKVLAAQASLAFGNQGVGTTSTALTVPLYNTGASSVTITSVVASAGYIVQSGTGTCATATVVASGGSCTVSVAFAPTALGASTGTVTVTDNSVTQIVNLTGTGTLAPSTVALSLTPNPIDLGATTTASVKVTAPAGISTVPSGTVTFVSGSTTLGGAVTLATDGTASLAFGSLLAPGTYPVVANYSGDANFLPGANSPAVPLVVNGIVTTLALNVTPVSPQILQTETLTATVTHAPNAQTAVGTVSFFDGTTLLKVVNVGTNGQAAYPVVLSYGAHKLSASYSGDALYNPSVTTVQTLVIGPGPIASLKPAIVNTIAGGLTTAFAGDNGPATAASLSAPYDVAVDVQGSIYIADCNNNRVRKVTAGIITTFAGTGSAGYGGDGGLATKALFRCPRGLATDSYGNLFIADYGNNVIREVNAAGIVTLVAGTVATTGSYSGDGGPAISAFLSQPWGLATDIAGNLYIADSLNSVVRKVDTTGIISTIAGNKALGASSTGDNGPGTSATLNDPVRLALDATGNLYISEFAGNRVRKLAPNGTITTYAGNGTATFAGDGGLATSASLSGPYGIATDAAGDLYIADKTNAAIRMVSASGIMTTIAGTGVAGYTGNGGSATTAQFLAPWGVAVDGAGNVYVSDTTSLDKESAVRELTVSTGAISFGTLTTGGAQALPVVGSLTNAGATNLTLTSIAVTGAGFSLLSGTPNGCTATTVLAPGASCAFAVNFTYSVLGTSNGTLAITDNSGDATNAVQTVTLTAVTVLPTVTVQLGISPVIFASPGASVTLTATLTPGQVNPGPPTGAVTFTANGTPIGSGQLSGGVATISSSTLPLGAYAIVASYGGDVNYQPAVSASQTYTISYDFTMTVTPSSADIPMGQSVNATLTLTPAIGFTVPVILSCTNLPYGYTCVFGTPTLTSDGSGAVLTSSLVLKYTPTASLHHSEEVAFYALLLLGAPLFVHRRAKFKALLLAMGLFSGALLLNGCGSGTQNSELNASYPINVIGTAGVVVHISPLTIHLH